MLGHYLIIAYRALRRRAVFSFINIAGLAVGMAACLLILQYVTLELSYDNFHSKGDDLYRVRLDRYNKGELTTQWAAGCAAIGPALKGSFPEVADYAKLRNATGVVSHDDRQFREERMYYATSSLFSMFSYPHSAFRT